MCSYYSLLPGGNLLIFPQTVVVVGNTIILKASGIVLNQMQEITEIVRSTQDTLQKTCAKCSS